MHEMSLCEGILHILEAEAARQQFCQVRTVWLEIGALAGVEIESLRFCFDAVMRRSLAAGAKLEIIVVPAQAWCLDCAQHVALAQRYDACPHCGGHALQAVCGTELRVKELEVV